MRKQPAKGRVANLGEKDPTGGKRATSPKPRAEEDKRTSPVRHEYHCRICSHPKRVEIEQAFVTWSSPVRISKEYGVSRDSVYRHAHALGLMAKRRRNVRSALERIIEKAGDVEATAAAVVSAVAAYAKINANGHCCDHHDLSWVPSQTRLRKRTPSHVPANPALAWSDATPVRSQAVAGHLHLAQS
jgi:hypothetical protein